MTAGDWLAAAALAFALSSSGLLDGPTDIQAERDTAEAVKALGQP